MMIQKKMNAKPNPNAAIKIPYFSKNVFFFVSLSTVAAVAAVVAAAAGVDSLTVVESILTVVPELDMLLYK